MTPALFLRTAGSFPLFVFALWLFGCQPSRGPEGAEREGSLARVVLTGAGNQRCGFPPKTQVKSAIVVVRVMVLADGKPQFVEVTGSSNPGEGFEEAARECAMRYRYRAAKDASGKPRRDWSYEFNVEFAQMANTFTPPMMGR